MSESHPIPPTQTYPHTFCAAIVLQAGSTMHGWSNFVAGPFPIGVLLCLNSPPASKKTQVGCVTRGAGVCDNRCAKRFCSVGLEADMVDSSSCPPEGGRYIEQKKY